MKEELIAGLNRSRHGSKSVQLSDIISMLDIVYISLSETC